MAVTTTSLWWSMMVGSLGMNGILLGRSDHTTVILVLRKYRFPELSTSCQEKTTIRLFPGSIASTVSQQNTYYS